MAVPTKVRTRYTVTKPVNSPMIISVRSIPLKTRLSKSTRSTGKNIKQIVGIVQPTIASTSTPRALACANSGVLPPIMPEANSVKNESTPDWPFCAMSPVVSHVPKFAFNGKNLSRKISAKVTTVA